MIKFRKKIANREGFSFIEGIVAAFIVTVGMVAIIQLMAATLLSSYNSRNQIVATFLAQEGVEIFRNIRDNSWAQGVPTFNNPNFPAAMANCRVDMLSTNITDCVAGSNILKLDSATGRYLISGAFPNSRFKRKLMISYNTNDKTTATLANVVSVVIWSGGNVFPAPIDDSTCNQLTQCAFTKATINKWGEK